MNAPEREPTKEEPLDVRIARIEERVASIQQHGATKADANGLKADIKGLEAKIGWWLLGVSVLVVVGLVLQVAR